MLGFYVHSFYEKIKLTNGKLLRLPKVGRIFLTMFCREKFSMGSQAGKGSNKTGAWFQASAAMYMRSSLF